MSVGLRLITSKRTFGAKIETTPYTAETLAAADYDFSVYEITYNTEIEEYVRKLGRGDYSRDKSVPGKRKFTCSVKVDLHPGNTVSTAPQYFQLLRACCLKQIAHGSTGISLITDSNYDRVPVTIETVERQEGAAPKQLVLKAKGCMGNARLVFNQVGQPVAIEFEFQGALVSVTTRAFASLIAPTGFDTSMPPAILAATFLMYGTTQCLRNMTIDLGNVVELFSCPGEASGYEGARVVDREPTIECDPDMLVTDDINWLSNHTSATTGALALSFGSNLSISAPAIQTVQSYNPGEAEGHITNQLKFKLIRGATGNDELELLQGSKT